MQFPAAPRILSIGTAVPPRRYTQEELRDLFAPDNPRIRRLFTSGSIRTRHLILPEPGPLGMPKESIEELNEKHKRGCIEVGGAAVEKCLEQRGLAPADVDFLICVTTTGYLCPGVSARLIKQMGFRENVHRIDVVGMGCNAGLNALQPAASFCSTYPGRFALMLCVEICSAAYVYDKTIETAVVNSLFGDGAAAVLLRAAPEGDADEGPGPRILGFESQIVTDAIETMRFDLRHGKLSFFLDPNIPYGIGANCEKPVNRLLARFGLKRREIGHWVVHSGGKKVIDSVKMNLDLTDHDVRHTLAILRDYGNISSSAYLFSLRELMKEGVVRAGDYGVLMSMGPGAAIETALVQW